MTGRSGASPEDAPAGPMSRGAAQPDDRAHHRGADRGTLRHRDRARPVRARAAAAHRAGAGRDARGEPGDGAGGHRPARRVRLRHGAPRPVRRHVRRVGLGAGVGRDDPPHARHRVAGTGTAARLPAGHRAADRPHRGAAADRHRRQGDPGRAGRLRAGRRGPGRVPDGRPRAAPARSPRRRTTITCSTSACAAGTTSASASRPSRTARRCAAGRSSSTRAGPGRARAATRTGGRAGPRALLAHRGHAARTARAGEPAGPLTDRSSPMPIATVNGIDIALHAGGRRRRRPSSWSTGSPTTWRPGRSRTPTLTEAGLPRC